jgi:hypothetical protein
MVKKILSKIVKKNVKMADFIPWVWIGLILGCAAGCTGCASSGIHSTFQPKVLDVSSETLKVTTKLPLLWSKTMRGAISGLSMAKNGQAILVATSPDPDIVGSASSFLLSWLDSRGKLVWRKKLASPIKDQDLSPDGKFAVVTNYSDEVMAYNEQGKQMWTQKGTCRPYVLPLTRKTLCYHDDDPESDIAFDVFDLRGEKVLSYPISADILSLKYTSDERYFVLALTRGWVVLLDSEFRLVWERKVEGELIDVSVSSGDRPTVSALFRSFASGRQDPSPSALALFDLQGNMKGRLALEIQPIQLEFSSQGNHLALYGNGKSGQHLQVLNFPLPGELSRWRWPASSDYSIQMASVGEGVFMGIENPISRRNHLLYFENSGKQVLNWEIPGDERTYLYAYRVSQQAKRVAIATDDGKIAVFRLN